MSPLPRLHAVTDDAVLARSDFLDRAAEVLDAGGGAVALHVRGPGTAGRRTYDVARALAARAAATGSVVCVNDRVDVALLAGVGWVHLGANSLPVAEARRLLGPEARVGVSVHDAAGVAGAAAEGADFTFVGTIHPTPSHPGRAGQGVEGLRAAVTAAAGLPVIAIGGVEPDRVAALLAAGAHGVAAVRGVWASADPARAVAAYLDALKREDA